VARERDLSYGAVVRVVFAPDADGCLVGRGPDVGPVAMRVAAVAPWRTT